MTVLSQVDSTATEGIALAAASPKGPYGPTMRPLTAGARGELAAA